MRATRLVELLIWLQLRGGAPAAELAETLGVSVRTVYRDVDALSAAGVPVYTEIGRYGGIRIDPSYRLAGLPRLPADEARGLLFAVVPSIADQLGLDAGAAERTLMPAMERSTEIVARAVRDRIHVEPTHWFLPTDESPALAVIARAAWESHEVLLRYRGDEVRVQPLGLVLKGDRWYLLTRAPGRSSPERQLRLFRVSRVEAAERLDQHFERPPGFDLAREWARLRQVFVDSLPEYDVTVRIAPRAEQQLALLAEGRPKTLPLVESSRMVYDGPE